MMETFLVVRTLDVSYALVPVKRVLAALNGGAPQPLLPTAQGGVSELKLPAGTTRIEVSVDATGFWPISQKLTLQTGKLSTLAFDGRQAINTRDLEAHSRGNDSNVIVNLVLGQVKDARAKVDAVFAGGGVFSITPAAHHIRDLGATILDPGGTGWDRLKHTVSSGKAPDGKMFFVERQTAPKLVAIYQPSRRFQTFQRDGQNPIALPVPYHVFFHPSTSQFDRQYPFHAQYIDLVSRYMLLDQIFDIGKAMVNQHVVAGKNPVFVFPVGSPTESFGKIPRQADLLRLLQEINYWLQRMDGIAYPGHPVGHCAVSGYSAACEAIRTMLGAPFAKFDTDHLREIYGFDLYTPDNVPGMCRSLTSWFRRGGSDRKLRIYTQNDTWRAEILAGLPRGTKTSGPSNAFEEETPSSTLLFDPVRAFWTTMGEEAPIRPAFGRFDAVPGTITAADLAGVKARKRTQEALQTDKYYEVHGMHPALFLTHALKLSTFAD